MSTSYSWPHSYQWVYSYLVESEFMDVVQKRVDGKFETMFETGVNELSWDDTVSKHLSLST